MNETVPVEKPILERMDMLLKNLRRWEDQIRVALHHGRDAHKFDDIVAMIMANRVHFYALDKSFTIMEVLEFPQYKVYHCFLAGGELKGVIESIEPMSQVARALNCKYLSMSGRKGWGKVLAERGWKHITTTMYLEV